MNHLVNYQREVYKGKLTAVGFQNSLRRLIYPYQLHVDNYLSYIYEVDYNPSNCVVSSHKTSSNSFKSCAGLLIAIRVISSEIVN